MPEIELIPEVLHEPNQPYHFHYDNLPLKAILDRLDLINSQVDINTSILRGTQGTTGSLGARLTVSTEDDGTLKASAIDAALHSIEEHTDTDDYVRMTSSERDKLALIDSEATNIEIEVEAISSTVLFANGTVRFQPSDTVTWSIDAPDIVKAHSAFPADAAHRHNYDITPANVSPTPDYQNFKTTSINTPFIEDTLRVYVNGVRLSATGQVRVPDIATADTWTLTYVASQDETLGTFSLNRALDPSDIIRIDFDEDFT